MKLQIPQITNSNMGKTKVAYLNNSRIQKEQLQLCKIEKELEQILGTVNEAINELKVEELQLRAGAAADLSENYQKFSQSCENLAGYPSTSSLTNLPLAQIPQGKNDDLRIDALINRQIIDLDMSTRISNVEEEDDDDV